MSINALASDLFLQPNLRRAVGKSRSEQRQTQPTFFPQHIRRFVVPTVIPAFWCLDSTTSSPTGVVLSCTPSHHQSYERVHSRRSRSRVRNRSLERHYGGIEVMLSELRGKKKVAAAEQQQRVSDLTALEEARDVLENEIDRETGLRSPPVCSDEGVEEVGLSHTAATTSQAPQNPVAHSKSPTPPFIVGPSPNEPSSMISMATTEAVTEAAEDPLVKELFENPNPHLLQRTRPIIGLPGDRTEPQRLFTPGTIPHTVNPAAMKPPAKRKQPSDPTIYSPDPPLNYDSHPIGNVEEGSRPPSKRARRGVGKVGVLREEAVDPPSHLRRNVVVQRRTKRALPSPPPAVSARAIMETDSVIPVASPKRSRWKLRGLGGPADRAAESMGQAGRSFTTSVGPAPTHSSPPTARVTKSRPHKGAVTRTLDSTPVQGSTSIPFHSPRPSSDSHARMGTGNTGTSSRTHQSPVTVSSLEGPKLPSGPRRSARIRNKIATLVVNNTPQPSRRLRSTNTTNASASAGTTGGRLHKSPNGAPRRKKKN